MKNLFALVILSLLLSSCARSFHAIHPAIFKYDNKKVVSEDITVSYQYGVQEYVRNRPYARKERKDGYKLVAVKIQNSSDSAIVISEGNFSVKNANGKDIRVISIDDYCSVIRQYSGTYTVFYGLAGIGYVSVSVDGKTSGNWTYNPIPLFIGIGNTVYSEISNWRQKKNLKENCIYGMSIEPDTFIYGLIAIEEYDYPELNFYLYW